MNIFNDPRGPVSQSEERLGARIAARLEEGALDLPHNITERLRAGRVHALLHRLVELLVMIPWWIPYALLHCQLPSLRLVRIFVPIVLYSFMTLPTLIMHLLISIHGIGILGILILALIIIVRIKTLFTYFQIQAFFRCN